MCFLSTGTALQVLDFYAAQIAGSERENDAGVKYICRNVRADGSVKKTSKLKPMPTANLVVHRLALKLIGCTAKVEFEYSADVKKGDGFVRHTFIHQTTIKRAQCTGKINRIIDTVEKIVNPDSAPTNVKTVEVALKYLKSCFSNQFGAFSELLFPSVSNTWVRIRGGFEEGDRVITKGPDVASTHEKLFFQVSTDFDIHSIEIKVNGPHAAIVCDVDETKTNEHKRYHMICSDQLSINDAGQIETKFSRNSKDEIPLPNKNLPSALSVAV